MNNKSNPLDIISYFFKFIILVLIGLIAFLFISNTIELFTILFSDLDRKYCTYGAIKGDNNIVSQFIISNYIESYGSYNNIFIKDESTSVLSITIFLRLFEVLKYLYLGTIGVLSFIIFNNYSKNKIICKENKIHLIIISIMLILIPIFLLLRNSIGCIIVDSYEIKDPTKAKMNFEIFYLIFGLLILLINFNYFKKFKFKNIIYISISSLLFIYFSFELYNNSSALISTLGMSSKECEYYELIKVRHSFLRIIYNSFDLFGNSWTYLGLYTSLKNTMITYYILNIVTNLSIIVLLFYFNIKLFLYKNLNIRIILLCLLGVIILIFISELITNINILNSYKEQDYPNPNLSYNILNHNNFYLIYFALLTYILSFKNYRLKEEN